MRLKVVTLSPQGQFTIPSKLRKFLNSKKYVLEIRNEVIILKPCRVQMQAKDNFINREIFRLALALEGLQKELFHYVDEKPRSFDEIITKFNKPVPQINILLSELELKGLIRRNASSLWEVAS